MVDYSKPLGISELARLWVAAGGDPKARYMAAAVAMAESGGRNVTSPPNHDGSVDRGYWQINSGHGALSSLDPMTNARAAVQLSGNGKNWRPWCTAWSDNACGSKGGSYARAGSSAVGIYNDLGGNAEAGGIFGGITQGPPATQPGTDLHVPAAGCRFGKVDLKFTSFCPDKVIGSLAIAGGGVLILAGVAVLLVATVESTPAGRAATQALAVATPVTRALKAAPARRSAARSATEQANRQEQSRLAAAERHRAAEARRDAAEARRRTDARRRARLANAEERRRRELHAARVANLNARTMSQRGPRSFDGPNAGRSTASIVAANRARNARRDAAERPPF